MRKREAEAVAVAAAGKSARILHQFMDKAAELFQDMVAVILSVKLMQIKYDEGEQQLVPFYHLKSERTVLGIHNAVAVAEHRSEHFSFYVFIIDNEDRPAKSLFSFKQFSHAKTLPFIVNLQIAALIKVSLSLLSGVSHFPKRSYADNTVIPFGNAIK